MSSSSGFVRVRGARENNLRDVDVDLPRDALVVFTGVSGSGKSSLAFGTLYAEAQRRYLDSVSPYARRLIEQVGAPDFDSIEGLPPAVALQQRRGTPSARSSLGTVTTISNLLRMLYSRAGTYPDGQPMLFAEDFSPHTPQGACPHCHGLGRVYDVTEASMVPDDSLTIRERAIASWPQAWGGQNLRDILVSLGYDVDVPWRDLPAEQRRWILTTDETPTVPVYPGLTPAQTRAAVRRKATPDYHGTFTSARNYVLHTFATTQSELMKKRVARFMTGTVCPVCHGKRLKREASSVTFAGRDIAELSSMSLTQLADVLEPAARGQFDDEVAENEHDSSAARSTGRRKRALDTSARERSAQAHRARVASAGHAGARDVLRTPNLSEEKRVAAQRIAHDVLERVQTLRDLGLGYLSLDRGTPTLSPGELQRVRLATQIRSNLFGVVYVLDEPSAGLHPADGEALLVALDRLKHSGNSLFVVEHDLAVMRHADWIVDVGPGAGENGGRVLYSGPLDGLRSVAESRTAAVLFAPPSTSARSPRTPRGWLRLEDVTHNNLRGVDVEFPIGALTTVTGVSGSGKSSLVSQALVELVSAHLGHEAPLVDDEEHDELASRPEATSGRVASGAEAIRRMVRVDQRPIGRTPRSNLATYTGLFDGVRKLFAATPEARARRYGAGRFSFNVRGGRCETCEGEGVVGVELLFMPSVYAPCSTCHGTRYEERTLEVRLRGRSIADVLAMNVDEALEFFVDEPSVHRPLELLRDIGLGYLRLGQPATELSGGEAQRIKLATELQRVHRADTLYVLDEPTTGLHPSDVDALMVQLDRLVDAGGTVVVVEHEMRVAAASDWLIDMGPGAGAEGGRVVVEGTPQQVAVSSVGVTAPYLARELDGATASQSSSHESRRRRVR